MTHHLRNISRRKAIKAFRKLGFEIDESRGKGSHAVIYHPDDLSRRTTLPQRDPIAQGTLRNMLRDLRVAAEDFSEAL